MFHTGRAASLLERKLPNQDVYCAGGVRESGAARSTCFFLN